MEFLKAQSLALYDGGREVQTKITTCETLLQSLRQIYILENIFTYHETKLHYHNTFTRPETNLQTINRKGNVPTVGVEQEVITGSSQYELLLSSVEFMVSQDGQRSSDVLPILWTTYEPLNVVLFFVWSVFRVFK